MKTVIIGYGHAGKAYLAACLALGRHTEIVLVDRNPEVRMHVPEGLRFYTSLPQEQFDLAIVATPPATHLDVLNAVHDQAARIIVEKPFALSRQDTDAIFELAQQSKIFFAIHARYGEELPFAQQALKGVSPTGDTVISQLFCDPYWPDGPQHLGGPFWDSIFNALGILNIIRNDVVFNDIDIYSDDEFQFDMACHATSRQGDLSYRLTIDWKRALGFKLTELANSDRSNGLLINHSQQCVSALSGLDFEQRAFTQPRLAAHYEAVVKDCMSSEDLSENARMAQRIVEQVFQINSVRSDASLDSEKNATTIQAEML